jgi:hypothetical protein
VVDDEGTLSGSLVRAIDREVEVRKGLVEAVAVGGVDALLTSCAAGTFESPVSVHQRNSTSQLATSRTTATAAMTRKIFTATVSGITGRIEADPEARHTPFGGAAFRGSVPHFRQNATVTCSSRAPR